MSSFRDNIGKENESEALDYDDSAFYFFACTILLIIVLVYSFVLFKSVFSHKSGLEKNQRSCN